MLGVCVFLWGLSYKLSLYNLNQRSLHTIPDAKLLSKDEDSRAVEGVQQALARAAFPLPSLLFQVAVVTIAIAWAGSNRRHLDERSSESKLQVALPDASLYFRPPPVHSAL
jgi:hypothetical protein